MFGSHCVIYQFLNGQGLHKRAELRLTALQTRGIKLNAMNAKTARTAANQHLVTWRMTGKIIRSMNGTDACKDMQA